MEIEILIARFDFGRIEFALAPCTRAARRVPAGYGSTYDLPYSRDRAITRAAQILLIYRVILAT